MIWAWLRKPIVWLIGAVLIALAAWWLVATLTGGKRAKVEAKLNGNIAGAALESGKDAVNTVGSAGAREHDLDRKVTDAQSKINTATDAAGADAAGRDGLCGISPDFCSK